MFLYSILLVFLCPFDAVLALWPLPTRETQLGNETLWLSPDVQPVYRSVQSTTSFGFFQKIFISLSGKNQSSLLDLPAETILKAAVDRMRDDMRSESFTFIPWKFYEKGRIPDPSTAHDRKIIKYIEFEQRPRLVRDLATQEYYELQITTNGSVLVSFGHYLGALHALSTFRQLFAMPPDQKKDSMPFTYAPVHIKDSPAFGHRGLNLDISRNVIRPKDVMRTIEGLALNKFNRLHLHASDAQSWPLEIPALPELAEKGAYHQGQIWSVAELKEVQTFGAYHGVEVFLEIDTPGHTASIHEAYPKLVTSYNRQPWASFSAQPCAGQLKLEKEGGSVTQFVDTLLEDLLPRTAPFSSHFHLGGDEVNANAYDMAPAELRPHLQMFVDHAIDKVQEYSFTPIVWEEHLLDFNLTLPEKTVVQVWRNGTGSGKSALAEVVSRGHKALFGSFTHWYLDCGYGAWLDRDYKNANSPIKSPFLDYCGPYKNWREVYSYDPLADIPKDLQHLVLGGEVHLWGELTDDQNMDSKLWPRVAAAGEILWRGKPRINWGEEVTRDLAYMRDFLILKGIAAGPVQNTWCLMHPGNCIL